MRTFTFGLNRERYRPTLALKLGFFVLVSTGLIFAIAFGIYTHVVRGMLLKTVKDESRSLAWSTVNQVETVLHAVEPLPQWMGLQLAHERLSKEKITQLLQDEISVSPHIYGGAVVFAAGAENVPFTESAPYVYRQNHHFEYSNLPVEEYSFQDWYLIPRYTGKPAWSDPYYDKGASNAMMCAYSVPLYRQQDGKPVFTGVAMASVRLEHLVKTISSIQVYKTGYIGLLSQSGQVVSHSRTNDILKESLFSLAEENKNQEWRDIGRQMIHGKEGFVRIHSMFSDRMVWVYHAPVSNGWSVAVLCPEDEVLHKLHTMNWVVIWIGVAGFLVLLSVISVLSLGFTRPIYTLAKQTQAIAQGNLDVEVSAVQSHDEVGLLSRSFEDMRLALREYMANLAATTAAKERIESELKIAQTIQRSFLPKRFPPFPDHSGFDVYAELQPAKEVGGDLYDYFLLDGHRLFFLIGDVSGKGVPAALLMAVTKTLMKGVAEQHLLPSQVLDKVNQELCADNEQMMFVTLCCGVLDLRTGGIIYTNAGHLPFLRLRPGQGAEWIELPKGPVLGITDDPGYENKTLQLDPKDTLVFYTDGVTEAMSPKQELFGEDRLLNLAEKRTDASPKDLVDAIFKSVTDHAKGEEQSDDITLLVLRYRHPETIALPTNERNSDDRD
jgi:sigma-B regulation protein RsbU (phosphoserine phosphatase)